MDRTVRRSFPGQSVAFACGVVALGAASPSSAQPSWNDTLVFRTSPYGEMHTLIEKTLFKVDVLTLRVRYDSAATARVRRLRADGGSGGDVRDSLAIAVIESSDLLADIEFLRDISLSQFLDGISDDMARAVTAGLLTDSAYRGVMSDLPRSFAFLEERRIHRGDRISYRMHADTLRTVYRDAAGQVLLDQVDRGRQRRNSVIATFLSPGSSFRRGLLASLPGADR